MDGSRSVYWCAGAFLYLGSGRVEYFSGQAAKSRLSFPF